MDNDFLDARIERTKTLIVIYEDAIERLETNPDRYASYTIETAQTRETVTKSNLSQIKAALAGLENRLVTLEARRSGGSTYSRPGF